MVDLALHSKVPKVGSSNRSRPINSSLQVLESRSKREVSLKRDITARNSTVDARPRIPDRYEIRGSGDQQWSKGNQDVFTARERTGNAQSSQPLKEDIAICNQKTNKEYAEALAKEIMNCPGQVHQILSRNNPRDKSLTRLISFLTMSNQQPLVLQLLEWVEKQPRLRSSRPFFYSKVLGYLSELEGASGPSVQLYKRMRHAGVTMDKYLYNSSISALGKAGEWGLCMQAYAEMLQGGLRADIYTYSSLIQACQCCGSRWKQATAYYQEMKEEGIKPNVITFTTLISCCQRAGRWRRAMQFFREMEEAGVRPDLKAYNSIISACARVARWEDAWDICSTMRRSGMQPDTRTYNALISACERAGKPERALEAYARMGKESGAFLP